MDDNTDNTDKELQALANLLNALKGSYVEKYAYFHNRDPTCKYVLKAKKGYIMKEKQKLISLIHEAHIILSGSS